MEFYYIKFRMQESIIFFWNVRIALFRDLWRLYTHIYMHTHTNMFYLHRVDFMKAKAFRISYFSLISKMIWNVLFLWLPFSIHISRIQPGMWVLTSSAKVVILLVIALSWAFNSLQQAGTSTRSTHLSTVAVALAYYESTWKYRL